MRLIDIEQFDFLMLEGASKDFVEGVSWILEQIDKAESMNAIPISVIEDIKAEIKEKYNKYRNMSDKWNERANGIGESLEIIDKHIGGDADESNH